MKRLGFVLALGFAALACGDNDSKPDAHIVPPIDSTTTTDGMIDGSVPAATLTSFVIDLVKNHTNSTELPKQFTDFSTLPDPDLTSNNLTAYSSLFM